MSLKNREKIKKIVCCGFLPVTVIILELLLRSYTGQPMWQSGLFGGMLTAFSLCCVCESICSLCSPKAASWLRLWWMELTTTWFLFAFFIEDSFTVFMEMGFVLGTASAALKDFGGNIGNVFTNGLIIILVFHLPVVIYLVLRRFLVEESVPHRLRRFFCFLLTGLLLFFAGHYTSTCTSALRSQYHDNYSYDSSVKNFGLLSALVQQWERGIMGSEESTSGFTAVAPAPSVSSVSNAEADGTQGLVETHNSEKVYQPNTMDIDFEANIAAYGGKPAEISQYAMSCEPTMKNEYTGMFDGKNLILITAEALSKEVIDPKRTPTLFRMATKGIVFEDFYQPAWGGSTSTGEYSWLVGLMPTSPSTMIFSGHSNLYFTMGNQLQRLGYFSAAYHNGSYDYYQRHLTHCNLGYSTWTAINNGLVLSPGFPKSDLELFDVTLPMYINEQPFSIYYMTISGHASYSFNENVNNMSIKNRAITEGLPYTEPVRAYLACNQELEYGLESMLRQLEEAGILDDTVIAIVPDHYPYGLMPSSAWGTHGSHLAELFGFEPDTYPKRDHNAAIIWCSSMESQDPIVVSGPTSSLDILPTLSNLFGLEYDSRLLAGRDALSGASSLVFWTDGDYLTDLGYYEHSGTFTPTGDAEVSQEYIDYWKNETINRMMLSRSIEACNYYETLFGQG